MIWYNRPYDGAVKKYGMKISYANLQTLWRKRADNFDKMFNRNTLKIGYSNTQTIDNIMKVHTKKMLQREREKNVETTKKKKKANAETKLNVPSKVNIQFNAMFTK